MARIHQIVDTTAALTSETLCHIPVVWLRDSEGKLHRFASARATRHPRIISCVWDPRDVTCSTCAHVWRRMGAGKPAGGTRAG